VFDHVGLVETLTSRKVGTGTQRIECREAEHGLSTHEYHQRSAQHCRRSLACIAPATHRRSQKQRHTRDQEPEGHSETRPCQRIGQRISQGKSMTSPETCKSRPRDGHADRADARPCRPKELSGLECNVGPRQLPLRCSACDRTAARRKQATLYLALNIPV